MSDFNGTAFILSPEAEEKYNDNDEYAKNWLDAKSEGEDRGLFSLYVKPGSGSLELIFSELLKVEKPFLKNDFCSLVLGIKAREAEFLALLKKHLTQVSSENTVLADAAAKQRKLLDEQFNKATEELGLLRDKIKQEIPDFFESSRAENKKLLLDYSAELNKKLTEASVTLVAESQQSLKTYSDLLKKEVDHQESIDLQEVKQQISDLAEEVEQQKQSGTEPSAPVDEAQDSTDEIVSQVVEKLKEEAPTAEGSESPEVITEDKVKVWIKQILLEMMPASDPVSVEDMGTDTADLP